MTSLTEMRTLSAAATPGPWRQEFYRDGEILPDGTGGMDDYETPGRGIYAIDESTPEGYCLTEFETGSAPDAEFIVAATSSMRALIRLGDAVHAKRTLASMSFREASAASGVAVATICDIEQGIVDVRLSTAFRLMEWVTS